VSLLGQRTGKIIVVKEGWYYQGCRQCNKKNDVDGPFKCHCGAYHEKIYCKVVPLFFRNVFGLTFL